MYILPHVENDDFEISEAVDTAGRLSAVDLGVILHFLGKAQRLLEAIDADVDSVSHVTDSSLKARDAVFFAFERMSRGYLDRWSKRGPNVLMAEIFDLAYWLAEEKLLVGEPRSEELDEDLEARCRAAVPLVELMLGIFHHSSDEYIDRQKMFVNLVWHWITHSGICAISSARFIADDIADVEPSCEARLWLLCNDLCEQFAGELFGHPIRQGEYELQKADKDLSHGRDHRPQPG